MENSPPDLLQGLTLEESRQVLALGVRRMLPSGAQLFALGEPADALFLIARGRVKLTLPMQVRGRDEDILVEERGPGQVVGWSALTSPYRFTSKASALLETEVVELSRDVLRDYFTANPAAGYRVSLNLAAVIGERLQLYQAMWLRQMQRVVELQCA